MSKRKTVAQQTIQPVAQPQAEPPRRHTQILVRHLREEKCGRCGGVNTFKQSQGIRARGTVYVASARCRICGNLAQVRMVPSA